MENPARRKIRSYVLRGGRLSELQKRALDELGSTYIIPFDNSFVNISNLLPQKKIVAEIGFGMGLATAEIAEKNPETSFLGIEVHPPGVGKLLSEIKKRDLPNIRIIQHDAVEVFQYMLGDDSLDGIHIFFPDPWPKKKHRKRRIIQPEFVDLLIRKLKIKGYIHVATDWEDYAQWILGVFRSKPQLKNQFIEFADNPMIRPITKFEIKGLEKNHLIRDIYFIRIK